MLTLLGQKIGMTQVFAPDGATIPVTIVHVPEARVIALKTAERDGYSAVQIGTRIEADSKKAERVIAMPQLGHLKASGVAARTLFEVRVEEKELANFKPGAELKLEGIEAGSAIDVQGTSKGHGFQGVVKRHHFKGGPASHGHKDNLRAPGAINSGHPQHVMPGRRMAGHMGDAVATLKKLEVISVDQEKRVVLVKGSMPGAVRSWVYLIPTGKSVKNPIKDRKAMPTTAAVEEGKPKREKKEGKKK
jgi:large subunit ribosomal protein L3